jgi:methylglutaconyl-CoA hydratase
MEGYVNKIIEDGLAMIEFFHPKSNSMPALQLSRLASSIEEAGRDPEVKLILLKSGGDKAFCAGANFDELLSISNDEEGKTFFMGFANVINAIRKTPQLVICRVQGKCVGGGVGLAAAADYTIATVDAEVKLSELSVGLGPFVVGPVIERKTGLSAFSQLTINAGTFQSAEWAKEKGLYMELHPTIDSLDEAVYKLASTLLQSNPDALIALKEVFWKGTAHWDDLLRERAETSGRLVLSEFTRNWIMNFRSRPS